MGTIDREEQAKKRETNSHKEMKDWVSNNKRCPYKEEYYNAHLHRPIVKVHLHQLNKVTGKPTGRLPTLTPNTTLIKMNDVVEKRIDRDFPIIQEGQTLAATTPLSKG